MEFPDKNLPIINNTKEGVLQNFHSWKWAGLLECAQLMLGQEMDQYA